MRIVAHRCWLFAALLCVLSDCGVAAEHLIAVIRFTIDFVSGVAILIASSLGIAEDLGWYFSSTVKMIIYGIGCLLMSISICRYVTVHLLPIPDANVAGQVLGIQQTMLFVL